MTQYISLLRGINVGGRNIKMKDLISCYEALGFSDVQSVLQSGNLKFKCLDTDTNTIRNILEPVVSKKFDYNARIFVLLSDDLDKIVSRYPFTTKDSEYQYYVLFVEPDISSNLFNKGEALNSEIEELSLGSNVVYWKVKKGQTTKSPFSKLLLKPEFKDSHTNRNINTLKKLLY